MEKYNSEGKSLTDLIPFTQSDLATNKCGQLTARQIQVIQNMPSVQNQNNKEYTLSLIILWYLAILSVALFTPSFRENFTGTQGIIILIAPMLTALVNHLLGLRKPIEFTNQTKTLSSTGKVRKDLFHLRGVNIYNIFLGKDRFGCDRRLFDSIEDEQSYTFYYVPNVWGNTIVSWETTPKTNL